MAGFAESWPFNGRTFGITTDAPTRSFQITARELSSKAAIAAAITDLGSHASAKGMRPMAEVYLSIDQTPEGAIQVSINDEGGGYRISGPKYDGRSKTIRRHKITDRDVQEIGAYLALVKKPQKHTQEKSEP